MKLDLIDISKEKKERKNKVILSIAAISLIVIVVFSMLGVQSAKYLNKQKELEENLISIQRISHKVTVNYQYTLTEQGKNNVKNIYTMFSEKTAFLTFDDGPSKTVTPLILDLLKQEDIRATFFVLGSRVEFYPQIVRREFEEGHFIANHGYSHVYSSIYTTPESVLDEYYRTETCIKNALQMPEYNSNVFRFPGGSVGGKYADIKNTAKQLLDDHNIVHLDWNALTGDSEGRKTTEQMLEYVKNTIGTKSCVVILMHDAGDKILTYEILPQLIAYLREQGYAFKNLYDVLKTDI